MVRPSLPCRYAHLDSLFTAQVDWIATKLPDMLRVALSIKAGPCDREALATLSPCQTEHINRFGNSMSSTAIIHQSPWSSIYGLRWQEYRCVTARRCPR